MTFVSYAQNFEDVILWRALKHVEKGFYIDVGAFNSKEDSVTRAFYDRGWHGINIEPNPKCLAELNKNRIHDINLGVAIGDRAGIAKLHVVQNSGLTTVRSDIAKTHEEAGWKSEVIEVEMKTLTNVWQELVSLGQAVHFLKIDVEGYQDAALRGLDLVSCRPWILVVESTFPSTQDETHADWEDIVLSADYSLAYWDGLNRFYVAKERVDLLKAFSVPPNIFDDFVLARFADPLSQITNEYSALTKAKKSVEDSLKEQSKKRQAAETKLAELSAFASAISLQSSRSVFQKVFFRESGRPKKALRRLLFHNSGRPRNIFMNFVFHSNGRPRGDFRRWILSEQYLSLPWPRYHRIGVVTKPDEKRLASISKISKVNHLISVVVIGSENDQVGLSKTLASLLGQNYRNIEIILAGGASPQDYSVADFRTLRGLFVRPEAKLADFLSSKPCDGNWRGDYLLFAPTGTVFAPRCFELANDSINNNEEAFPDLAVFDYQLIQADGTESDPVFLPGWDPEFALSTDNYKTAFLASRKLLKDVEDQSASTELNAWIRSVAQLHPQPEHVHISEPVINFVAKHVIANTEKVRHRPESRTDAYPTVSLIIPNRNRPDLLKSCLRFLEHIQGIDLDLIIVDNNSDDSETLALYRMLSESIDAKIVNAGSNFNYSRMINLGVAASESELIALVNNDVEFGIPGEFEVLVQQAMRPEIGIVGARLFYPSGNIQHAGVVLDTGVLQNAGKEFNCRHVFRGGEKNGECSLFPKNANRSYLAVTGAVQVMKRKTHTFLSGYDEVNLPIEYNDIDFCLRAKKEGLRVLCVSLDGVYHGESESRGKVDTPEVLRMRKKGIDVMVSRWGAYVESHPYGHPLVEIGDCSKPYIKSL